MPRIERWALGWSRRGFVREGELSWWLPGTMGKSQYYVWFLGARPTGVLRCPDTVLTVLRRLLLMPLSPPPKLTIQVTIPLPCLSNLDESPTSFQISEKGVKLSPSCASETGKRKGRGQPPALPPRTFPPHAIALTFHLARS